MKLNEPIKILLERYLSELTLELSTIALYRKIISIFIIWLTKSTFEVKEPTRAAFCTYWQYLRNEGKTVRTIDSYTAGLRGFFKWLVENDYFDRDITAGTKCLRKTSDYVRAPLSLEQLDQLLNSVKGTGLIDMRNYAVLNLMAFLGLRRIEVTRLNVNDIYQAGESYYIRIQGKGHSEKDAELQLTDEVLSPIRDYWSIRPGPITQHSPAFVSHARSGSARLAPSFISKMVKRSLRKIGIDDSMHSCHSLRHSAASLAFKAGCSVHEIQSMLRQKNPSTTEIYLRSFRQRQAADSGAIHTLNQYYRKYKETGQEQ